MNENLLKKIKNILDDDNEIVYGDGNSERIQYTCRKEKYNTASISIYLYKKKEIAIVWNLKFQRERQHDIKTQCLSKCTWDNVLPEYDEIKDWYKRMGTKANNPYEKVLAMSFNTLLENISILNQLLALDTHDTNIPNETILQEKVTAQSRTRTTVDRWNRNVKFRKKVLNAYRYQCAICRCKEEKILEAAHIIAVYEGGEDKLENGISLCRNHHAMLDKGLIMIDYKKLELIKIAESVKSMPWYEEFVKKYDKKILSPLISNDNKK